MPPACQPAHAAHCTKAARFGYNKPVIRSLLPPGTLEFLLFAVLVAAFVFVVRVVRKRTPLLPVAPFDDTEGAETIPFFETPTRFRGAVRRVFRDRDQDATLIEAHVGKKSLIFRAADVVQNAARYQSILGESVDFAVYGLATLRPGGAEAMRHQIKDWSENVRPDTVGLFPAGAFANDYAVIARVLSRRDETIGTEPVWVYRAQVVKNGDQELFMELAADAAPPAVPLDDNTLAHGSVRLFGVLAPD